MCSMPTPPKTTGVAFCSMVNSTVVHPVRPRGALLASFSRSSVMLGRLVTRLGADFHRIGWTGSEQVEQSFFHAVLGVDFDVIPFTFADQADGVLDQFADHALDVATVVPDLGVLGRFDFDERRARSTWPDAGRSRFCRLPSGRSSGCSSARLPPQSLRAVAAAASDCGWRSPPLAWRRPARRCAGPSCSTICRGVNSPTVPIEDAAGRSVRTRQFLHDDVVDWCRYRCRRRSPATCGQSPPRSARCERINARAAATA